MNLAHFNLALGTAPARHRTACLAVRGLSVGIVQAVAALAGGAIAHTLYAAAEPGPLAAVHHHALFVLSSLGRLALLGAAARLEEKQAWSALAIARLAGGAAAQLFADRLEAGWALLRRYGGQPPKGPTGTQSGS